MKPYEAQAYLQKSAPAESLRQTTSRALDQELRERGIPSPPDTPVESGFLGFSLVFLGMATVFAITAVVVRTALPG